MGEGSKLDEPIVVPERRKLISLREAADYIMDRPAETTSLADWQLAIEALALVSESGPTPLARLAFLRR